MEEKVGKIVEFLDSNKLKDISVYNLEGEKRLTKCIVIATSPNFVENKKMAQELAEFFGLEKMPEGFNKGEWIIYDLDEIVVHSFIPAAREKYNLDKLWQNRKVNDFKQSKKSKK